MATRTRGEKIFNVINIIIMCLLILITVYPFLNQIALSFSSTSAILAGKVNLYPVEFTTKVYGDLLKQTDFWQSYGNTIIYTVLGTAIGVTMTTLCSYGLSKHVVGTKFMLSAIVFTMFFGAGLIPHYMLIKSLKMTDTIWAILIPGAIVPYNVLIMRTFFLGIPQDLEDAAQIDGLTQFGYFLKIALPLSKPILATITLFISVVFWNDWFSALIYLDSNEKYPVTLYLRNIMMGQTLASQSGQQMDASQTQSIPQSIQAASMLVVILPIMLIYPKVQKYFVKGVMIGAIKG